MSTYDGPHIKAGDDPEITSTYGERSAKINCQHLLPHIKSNSKILDVGCGPGSITSDFAKIAFDGTVIGADTSEGILQQARSAYGSQANLIFAIGDAYHLPFDDNTFDIVHAHALLIHLQDPTSVIKEFARVIKPGGLISLGEGIAANIISLKPDLPALRDFMAFNMDFLPTIGFDVYAGEHLVGWASEAGIMDGEAGWKVESGRYNIPIPSLKSRVTGHAAEMTIETSNATPEMIEEWRKGWETWEEDENAEFIWEAGTLLAWKPLA